MIAIDDFGTGYSSLAYLRQFPVDALKIDRSFVAGITHSSVSKALIHTLIELAQTLGLRTIGEGIEEEAQLRHLQSEQCDAGQGFLFSVPVPGGGDPSAGRRQRGSRQRLRPPQIDHGRRAPRVPPCRRR